MHRPPEPYALMIASWTHTAVHETLRKQRQVIPVIHMILYCFAIYYDVYFAFIFYPAAFACNRIVIYRGKLCL